MSGQESIPELNRTYRDLLAIAADRVVMIGEDEEISPALIKNGIVFIVAVWSGASQIAFRTLNKALAKLESESCPRVYVANTDNESAQRFLREQKVNPAGKGETFWIKEGKVVSHYAGYRDDLEVVERLSRNVL
jgi:hypothetical protein